MRTLILLTSILALPSLASTPDGATPAEEDVCDDYNGQAFGLCNAYCEAMDCDDPDHTASDNACENKRTQFLAATGEERLPCEPVVCTENIYNDDCPPPDNHCSHLYDGSYWQCQPLDTLTFCATAPIPVTGEGECDIESMDDEDIAGISIDGCGEDLVCQVESNTYTLTCDDLATAFSGTSTADIFSCTDEGHLILSGSDATAGLDACVSIALLEVLFEVDLCDTFFGG